MCVSCPVGPSLGHDGDESRAARTEQGITCGTCGRNWPASLERAWRVNRIIATLILRKVGNPAEKYMPVISYGAQSDNHASACAQDHGETLADLVRMRFANGQCSVELSFHESDVPRIQAPAANYGRSFSEVSDDNRARIPEGIQELVAALEEHGVRVMGLQLGGGSSLESAVPLEGASYPGAGLCSISLACGQLVGTVVFGLQIQINWYL
ncbi:MAG: hypothetical protein K2W82_16345 [Candidatus Obscuribacterales bacterium]|nr:hypothetical protein [Candidatus Obscuribacterales bacterium]